jgi:hypothetical protein
MHLPRLAGFLFLGIASCASSPPNVLPVAECADTDLELEASPVDSYWPPGTFSTQATEADKLARESASTLLCAMNEPSLIDLPGEPAFRLSITPSFKSAMAVRVYQQGNSPKLVAVRLDRTGYKAGPIKERVSRDLSLMEWRTTFALINATDFWNLPALPPQCINEDGLFTATFDATGWLLEARSSGRSHLVSWSAPLCTESRIRLARVAQYLLDLSGFSLYEH